MSINIHRLILHTLCWRALGGAGTLAPDPDGGDLSVRNTPAHLQHCRQGQCDKYRLRITS